MSWCTSWRNFDVMVYFWHHEVPLMSWRNFDATVTWRRVLDVMIYFWTSWLHIFRCHDLGFDGIVYFLTLRRTFLRYDVHFDFMTHLLRHEVRHFDVITYLWRHAVLLKSWCTFDVMKYFWCHEVHLIQI